MPHSPYRFGDFLGKQSFVGDPDVVNFKPSWPGGSDLSGSGNYQTGDAGVHTGDSGLSGPTMTLINS